MKTVELNIDNIHSPSEVKDFLEKKRLKKGDTLQLSTASNVAYMVFAAVILAIGYLFVKTKEKEKRKMEGERLLKTFFEGKSIEEIGKQIEKEYGIKVKMEAKNSVHDFKLNNINNLKEYLLTWPEMTDKEWSEIKEKREHFNKWK